MAKPAPVVESRPLLAPIDWVAGLRKTAPGEYAVIIGKVQAGVPIEWRVDGVSQSLQFASEALRMAMQRLVGDIP
jgi:hypothetical protein